MDDMTYRNTLNNFERSCIESWTKEAAAAGRTVSPSDFEFDGNEILIDGRPAAEVSFEGWKAQ